MYQVDDRDVIVELTDLPQCDTGAPLPAVVAAEHELAIIYLVSDPDSNWDGTYVTVVSPSQSGKLVATVSFQSPYAHFFGPPNDEAFSGHPLASRGLGPYGAFEVQQSSWIRAAERMNSVHPNHRPELFDGLRHIVLTFHDTTFECMASGYSFELERSSIVDVASSTSKRWRN